MDSEKRVSASVQKTYSVARPCGRGERCQARSCDRHCPSTGVYSQVRLNELIVGKIPLHVDGNGTEDLIGVTEKRQS